MNCVSYRLMLQISGLLFRKGYIDLNEKKKFDEIAGRYRNGQNDEKK